MVRDGRHIKKETLPNGLVVITEAMPQVRSVSLGIWVQTGSRREPPEWNGISHFIEHMLFKGTRRRTAEDIARSVDSIGGMLDAFTAKELVCFSTRVLDEHLPIAFDVLSDMMLEPLFREEDIRRERGVILEEIKMDEDNPDYLVYELFTQNFWRDHALGKPILGTPTTVKRFDHENIARFFGHWYAPNNMVITAAGNLQHQQVVDLVEKAFGRIKPAKDGLEDPVPRSHAFISTRTKKELEQVHICLGVPSYPMAHERRFACAVMNTILGGGMSSRLFQNIREKQGLAYAVFSDLAPYRDTGCLIVYAGTSPETTSRVIASIVQEFRDLKENGAKPDELRRAKDHLKGSMMLGLESTANRMSNLARQEMYFHRSLTLDEIIEKIEAVTAEDIAAITQEFFRTELISLAVLGRLNGLKISRNSLKC